METGTDISLSLTTRLDAARGLCFNIAQRKRRCQSLKRTSLTRGPGPEQTGDLLSDLLTKGDGWERLPGLLDYGKNH